MKITLIAPIPPDASAFGIRALSSYLKAHGQAVRLIFLPGGVEKFKFSDSFHYQYEQRLLEQVVELARDADLLGLSYMSHYRDRAEQLAAALKKALPTPLILGGIHPTVLPEQCLEHADMVCVGEGEQALLELMERMERGEDYSDVGNIWLKRDGKLIKNPLRPLCTDLDSLPPFDFGLTEHFMYDNVSGVIEPMSLALLQRAFPLEPHVEGSFDDSYRRTLSYKTMTTRGCPHSCTFCAERTLREMYAGERYLRKRSVEHIMQELEWVKREMPFVESIFLFDDTFLVRDAEEIRHFAAEYKARIGLPFHIQASPGTVTSDKMAALVDAGLAFVEMGIQSSSKRGKELYRRNTSEQSIQQAAAIFQPYNQKQIYSPCYHVILDNPWETPQDVRETLYTVLDLPRPFWLKRASLVLFPGTELYEKAKREGIINNEEDEMRRIYRKHLHTPEGTYMNTLMYLAGFSSCPRSLIRWLASDPMLAIFERPSLAGGYKALYRLLERLIVVSKGIRSLARGDFARIRRYLRKVSARTL